MDIVSTDPETRTGWDASVTAARLCSAEQAQGLSDRVCLV